MKKILFVLMLAVLIGHDALAESPRRRTTHTRNVVEQPLPEPVARPRVALVIGGGGA